MKATVLLLCLPRHVILTVAFVCGCHLLFLLNWISFHSPGFRYVLPATPPPNINYDHTRRKASGIPAGNRDEKVPDEGGNGDMKSPHQSWSSIDRFLAQLHGENTRALSGRTVYGPISGDTAQYIEPLRINHPRSSPMAASPGLLTKPRRRNLTYLEKTTTVVDLHGAGSQSSREMRRPPPAPFVDISSLRFIRWPAGLCENNEDSPLGAYLLVTVHSHPANRPQRDAIRDTWGRISKAFDSPIQTRVIFVTGIVGNEYTAATEREADTFRDVIIGDFVDSYINLTLKSLHALHWARTFCPGAKFILKTDDDSYVNIPYLSSLLTGQLASVSILGARNVHSRVMRAGMWAVSEEDYPPNEYPPYCTGCAYVLGMDTVKAMLLVAPSVRTISVEDVYITGILSTHVNKTCVNHPAFPQWHMGPSKKNRCLLYNRTLLGLHNVPFEQMYPLHLVANNSSTVSYHNSRNCSALSQGDSSRT